MVSTLTAFYAGFVLLTNTASFPLQPQNEANESVLSVRDMSLENRHENKAINEVFKDNILLNMAYMRGQVTSSSDIDWNEVREPFTYILILEPGETFAYHENVKPEYKGSLVGTTNAHFNASDGFRSSGYLYGDGVCHLASLIHYAAKDAGLTSIAPTNHDFAVIPQIPREYGVSIYYSPTGDKNTVEQNLYISNNFSNPVSFVFTYDGKTLSVSVSEQISTL